jgi:hypothetical protein
MEICVPLNCFYAANNYSPKLAVPNHEHVGFLCPDVERSVLLLHAHERGGGRLRSWASILVSSIWYALPWVNHMLYFSQLSSPLFGSVVLVWVLHFSSSDWCYMEITVDVFLA